MLSFCLSNVVHPIPLSSRHQLHPQSLESFDGPYDLWEEAAKESLELLLDAGNHPMILIDRYRTDVSISCVPLVIGW